VGSLSFTVPYLIKTQICLKSKLFVVTCWPTRQSETNTTRLQDLLERSRKDKIFSQVTSAKR